MRPYLVLTDPDDVDQRLASLSLAREPLIEAINSAHLYRARLTPNHPRTFFGLEMWGWAVAELRNLLRPYGYVRSDRSTYEFTIHKELDVAIVVASGDAGTGETISIPTTRSPKGKNTVDAVEYNKQLDLFSELIPASVEADSEEITGHDTWLLLHHTDIERKQIRIELSRPSEISSMGKIEGWSERLFIGAIDFDDPEISIDGPSGPDIDFEVRRKAS